DQAPVSRRERCLSSRTRTVGHRIALRKEVSGREGMPSARAGRLPARVVDRQVRQPPPVLGVPDADFPRPVGGKDLRIIMGHYGFERRVTEWLEAAPLILVGVPEPDRAIATGREQAPVLGEPDRRASAAVRTDRLDVAADLHLPEADGPVLTGGG